MLRVQLTYRKLHSRGYDHGKLFRKFMKLCRNYAVCQKYGVSESTQFWTECLNFNNSIHCNFNDKICIQEIIKPCTVKLHDIFAIQKQSHKLKACSIVLYDCETDPYISNNMQEADSSVTPSRRIPFGLYNPSNHCYINSVLQVILHLIQDNPWDIFNDNREGEILSDTMKYASISQLSYKEQEQLKRTLCHYNGFLVVLNSKMHMNASCCLLI